MELRAIYEENNGTFIRNSLPKKASFCVHMDNTECPENVFSDTPEIAQTQIDSAPSEQIPELQSTSHLDTIEPNVLTCVVETGHMDGMNDTLSKLMTDGAIEFLRDLEEDDSDLRGSVKRLKQTVKDLLTVSNKNVNITNEKYDKMTKFKRQSEEKAMDFEKKLKEITEKANKTDDSLDSVLGELDTVRKSVKKVKQAFHSVEVSLKEVDTRAGEMKATMVAMVESCNVALKEYEDQFQVQDNHISQIRTDAKKALTESTTNKLMIEGIRNIVSTHKETLCKLAAPNGPNLSLPIISNSRVGMSATPGGPASNADRTTAYQGCSRNDIASVSQDLGFRSVAGLSLNSTNGQGESASHSAVSGQLPGGRQVTTNVNRLSSVHQNYSSVVELDVMDDCDVDNIGLGKSDSNPGFQPVQVHCEVQDQRRARRIMILTMGYVPVLGLAGSVGP